jgi:hypothetical protein
MVRGAYNQSEVNMRHKAKFFLLKVICCFAVVFSVSCKKTNPVNNTSAPVDVVGTWLLFQTRAWDGAWEPVETITDTTLVINFGSTTLDVYHYDTSAYSDTGCYKTATMQYSIVSDTINCDFFKASGTENDPDIPFVRWEVKSIAGSDGDNLLIKAFGQYFDGDDNIVFSDTLFTYWMNYASQLPPGNWPVSECASPADRNDAF